MPQHYDPEFKKQIVRLHLEEGRTIISLQKEYTVSKAAISKWVKQFRDECQDNPKVLLLAVFVLALPKTFAKTCSHVLPHNGLKFGTSQDAKL